MLLEHAKVDYPIRRIPVTSQGKVVGIISRSDILKCILQ
ncbi:MAG: CBS domain-containing protein [Phycisphaerae bacterium]